MEAEMNQRPPPVAKKELRNGVIASEDSEQRFVKVSPARSSERSASINTTSRPSSNSKDSSTTSQDDQIESTKAEIGEIKEENQRLKTLLSQIVRDYQSLQMHFFEILKQERSKKETDEFTAPISHESEETELVSLRLGTNSVSGAIKLEEKTNTSNKSEQGLTLGLDCKYDINNSNCGNKELASNPSQDESLEEAKEDEAVSDPISPPSKNVKNLRSGDDEAVQQTHVKKARVSVRVRCQTPTMNDGCQWRKYGQKIAKGNPCPRAYYRCTVAPACPVRKQVQRCAEDMSILITTYEGNHNHPLPMSATAMASTTSAAATMLMTGSSTSSHSGGIGAITQPISSTFPSNNPSIAGINHLNFSRASTPFCLQNTTILPSPSHSTITLDLTNPPSSAAQYQKIPSSPSFSISMPSSWSNRGYISSSYQSHPQNSTASLNQNCLTDSIAKAITSNPSFQSVLHAAITSYVGASGSHSGGAGTLHPVQSHVGVSSSSSSQHGSLVVLQQPLMPMSSSKSATSQSLADSSWENMK